MGKARHDDFYITSYGFSAKAALNITKAILLRKFLCFF